jgi:hypothetical protein
MERTIQQFKSGIHNVANDELIPADAATRAFNWITSDGRIELVRGRQTVGGAGTTGKNYGEHTGYRADGTAVRFRKVGTKIQYLNGSTWTDIITGLTVGDVTFANYQSLAGAFTYIFDPSNGIYLVCTANPASYASLYDAAKNFKGYGLIDKGRTIMWGVQKDPTGLYGSYIDGQNSAVYTSVTGEAITDVATGTLAFKAGGATRTCFAVQITDTSSGEVFTDNYNGVLTGSLGSTGTINYMTGAFTITGQSGAGTANYQWWSSNAKGPTDFTKSGTRAAGEGFIIRQDAGGDAIKVVIPFDGSYFSLKKNSCYQFTLDTTDTAPTNELIRTDIGVPSLRSAVGTGQGIFFINTANPTEPQINILRRNLNGDNFDTAPLMGHFKWSDFTYDDVALETWDKYLLIGCAYDSDENNRLLLADIASGAVDVTYYGARCFTKNGGYLYAGDPVSLTTYELFTGFDDNGIQITNEWVSKGELLTDGVLKKTKKYRFSGMIDPSQSIAVYISLDNEPFRKIGSIRGDGDYVDYTSSYAIGTSSIGSATLGGDDTLPVYRFLMEIKVRAAKFRKRYIKFVAEGIGYCAIEQVTDFDIWTYENRLPKQYRQKQNVSTDGTVTDQNSPTY